MQMRDTAAFWLMACRARSCPKELATAEFAATRERLIKIGARVIESIHPVRRLNLNDRTSQLKTGDFESGGP